MKKSERDISNCGNGNAAVVYYSDCSGRRDILLTRKEYSRLKAMAKKNHTDVEQFIKSTMARSTICSTRNLANASIVLCCKKRVWKCEWSWKRIKTLNSQTLSAA